MLRKAAASIGVIQHKDRASTVLAGADHFGFFCSSKLNISGTVLWPADREQLMPMLLNSLSPARNGPWPVLTPEPCPRVAWEGTHWHRPKTCHGLL